MKTKFSSSRLAMAFLFGFVLIFCFAGWVYPQQDEVAKFPSHPITFIIVVSPGSGTDLALRAWCNEAEKFLGQPIVIVNKVGGGGTIGLAAIAAAKPDGYTIGHFGAGSSILVPLIEKIAYHPLKDLVSIAGSIQLNYYTVCVKGDSQFNSFKELIAYARQNPKKVSYGSSGVGSYPHLALEKIAKIENVAFTHIPFKGPPDMEVAILGSHIVFGCTPFTYSLLEAKKIKPLLFVTDVHGAPEFRQVPTVTKLYSEIPGIGRAAVGGPKGIPDGILRKLEDAFLKASKQPAVIDAMKKLKMSLIPLNAKETTDYIVYNYETYEKWVKEMGLAK